MKASWSVGASSSSPARLQRPSPGLKLIPSKRGTETGLPLVYCPQCGEEVLELVAGAGSKVPGAVFFKCRLHERDDPTSCPWIMFAENYEKMLIRKGFIGAKQAVPEFHTEVEGLVPAGGGRDNVVPLLGPIVDVDAKLKQLVSLGQIGVACIVVIAVFVVLGVIFLLFNRN